MSYIEFVVKSFLGSLWLNLNYQDQVNRELILSELRLLATILKNKKFSYLITDDDGIERTPQDKIHDLETLLIWSLHNLRDKTKRKEFSEYTRQARGLTRRALKISDRSWSTSTAEELNCVLDRLGRVLRARRQAHR